MRITMKIDFVDGTSKEVEARFADFVSFERTWNRSVTKFEDELRLTDLAWIAWHSEIRTKSTTKQFDPDWLNDVEALNLVGDEAEVADPLVETPQHGD
jgi:hypothetical protein